MIRVFILLLLLVLFLSGCVQHRYLTKIKWDGSVSHTYEAIGDSADLYDNKITLPRGLWWRIETDVVQDSSGNFIHTYRAKMDLRSPRNLPAVYAPETTHCPEIFLRHPIYFKRIDGLFGVLFLYKQTFVNRQKEAKYGSIWDYVDEECEILSNEQAADSLSEEERTRLENLYLEGLVDWAKAMMYRRCLIVLNRDFEFHPEVRFPPEQIQTALLAAKNHIMQWEPELGRTSMLLGEENLWESVGKPALALISQELNFIGDTMFFADLEILGDMYQWEYEITKDLEDDEFEALLTVPGYVFYNNADQVSQDSLTWNFSGSDIYDEDMVVTVYSIYVRWLPVIVFLAAAIALIVFLIIRRKPTSTPSITI